MAISHICQSCGWDLTRCRAVREPIYALPLVRCPSCDGVCVRRRHPLTQKSRNFCRVFKSLVVLIAQAAFGSALLAGTVAVLVGCGLTWNLGVPTSDVSGFWITLALTIAGLGLLTGLWLTVGLSHIDFIRAAAGWALAVMTVLAVTAMAIGYFGGLADLRNESFEVAEAIEWVLPGLAFFLLPGFAALCAIMAVALAAYPLGRVVLRVHAISRRATWRWMRRRRRLRLAT